MAWWDGFTPAAIDDRRKGAKTVQVVKVAKTSGIVAAIGLASVLGWCGHQQVVAPITVPADESGKFVAYVFGNIEQTWAELLGDKWRPTKPVIFSKSTAACDGERAETDMGPFYCPSDERFYLDPDFFKVLSATKACAIASGECQFAQAYIIAHEVGHHVQKIRGTIGSRPDGNTAEGVKIELQADCFAGVWAGRVGKVVTPAMVSAAANVARFGGDSGGRPSHGTAAQRSASFLRGYDGGQIASCPL